MTSPPAEPPGPRDCGGAARPSPLSPGSGSGAPRWPRGARRGPGCRVPGALPALASAAAAALLPL